MALRSDGTVVAWGDNSYGLTTVPAGLTNVIAISAGGFHNLVLKSDGTVVAWGCPDEGQTTIPAGLSGVFAISAGFAHNLVLVPPIVNQPPVAMDMIVKFGEYWSGEFGVPVSDPEGEPLTIVNVSSVNSTYGTVSPQQVQCDEWMAECNAIFSYTPPLEPPAALNFSFTYQVNDGTSDSNVGTVTLYIGEFPEAVENGWLAANSVPTTITLEGSSFGSTATQTFRIVDAPLHGILGTPAAADCETEYWEPDELVTRCQSTVVYTPESPPYTGEDSFTFVVNNGVADSLPATVFLWVAENSIPTAVGIDDITVSAATPSPIILWATDPDYDATIGGDRLSFAIDSLPVHGTLGEPGEPFCEGMWNGADYDQECRSAVLYTPTDPSYEGADSFTFHVNDSHSNSAIATASLTLRAPGTLTVNTKEDVNDGACDAAHCSLREAIWNALGGDTITFALPLPDTITLGGSPIVIDKNLTVNGPGADQLSISGGELSSVFDLHATTYPVSPFSVILSGLTIRDGRSGYGTGAGYGGGIYARRGSTLIMNDCVIGPNNIVTQAGGGLAVTDESNVTLNRCTITGNHGTGVVGGAGVWVNEASLTLINSTVTGNVTNNDGGGIHVGSNASVILNHSTVTNNTANADYNASDTSTWNGGGGGIFVSPTGEIQIQNSIVAGNIDMTSDALLHYPWPDVYVYSSPRGSGTLTSLGGNLIGDGTGSSGWDTSDLLGTSAAPSDPMLDTLAQNAPGKTLTHALRTGSPAIDALATCTPGEDQRGVIRPQGSACDIGAYELGGEVPSNPLPVLTGLSPASAVAGSTSNVALIVTGSDFIGGSVVRWNGMDLATTYNKSTQLTADVLATSLATVQTAQVTVYTPAPGGGTSSALAFFVTEASAGVTGQDVSSGDDPVASYGSTTATATGDGLLVVAQYDANPGGPPSFTASSSYFDVYVAPNNSFSQVSIAACDLNANDKLFWWDAATAMWIEASPQSYDSDTGCVTLIVTDSSSPSLTELQGTPFAIGTGTSGNTAPTAAPGGPYLGAINTAITFDGSASSDADGDSLTYAWAFGDSATDTSATTTHSYAAVGIYDVCLTVNDGTDNSGPVCTMAVVYDPSAGFVSGSGWILSPAGAYKPDGSLSGKATFGLVSKYKKGASVPEGNTEFQFEASGFKFHSTAYEWLVISKDKMTGQFKGIGTVNGALDPNGHAYKFMLWAGDGTGPNGLDTFRIRIWWEDADGVEHDVYDYGFNQEIGGGNIVVHSVTNKVSKADVTVEDGSTQAQIFLPVVQN